MLLIYDICYILFLVLYLPVFFFRRKMHKGFSMRFGKLPELAFPSRPLWIHAVSVGEMVTMKPLVCQIRGAFPGRPLVFSSITPTGFSIAQSIAEARDSAIYLPLDIRGVIRGVLDRIDPEIFVVAETEIWPNLFTCLAQRRVPIVIVNGRISDRSFGKYKLVRFLLRPYLAHVSLFCMQSDVDAKRIILMGAEPGKVRVTGNMKYDLGVKSVSSSARETLLRRLGFTGGERIIVAGSTHPGEEDILLASFRHLSAEFADIRLILAPRHPQRGEEVAALVRKSGFEPVLLSAPEVKPPAGRPVIHILDTVGQLMAYYDAAEIVFVGGSLVNTGGHNILEPAALGKPVVCGHYMQNFREVAEQFLRAEAVVQVRSQSQLTRALRELLTDTEKRRKLVEKSASIISASAGATQHTVSLIKQVLEI